MLGSSADMAWRSRIRLSMPYSARKACSAFAVARASLRQAFSQPVSRMRCAASALTIQSRCNFSDAPIRPCRAKARGLTRDGAALARKRTTQSRLRMVQAGSQRSAAFRLVRYDGSALQSDGLLSGRIEPLERMPAFPYEVSLPGSRRSTRITDRPRCRAAMPADTPTMPAPSTTTSADCLPTLSDIIPTTSTRRKRQAAIDRQQRAGDVTGLRRQQKGDHCCHLVGLSRPSERVRLGGRLPAVLVQRTHAPLILARIA